MRKKLPYKDNSFDIVYAHLSIHYFPKKTTYQILNEINRILKMKGKVMLIVNSINDTEYKTGEKIEKDFYFVNNKFKRFFSIESMREFTPMFETILIDDIGTTYKKIKFNTFNLIRYIGKKVPKSKLFKICLPFVGAIIQRQKNNETEILMQTRWKPNIDPKYSGTLEFPAGSLDKPFENIYEVLSREIKEETGLNLKSILNDKKTKIYSPLKDDASIGFKPFCCTQQLKKGFPWIGFVFICEVEDEEIKPNENEVKHIKWMKKEKIKHLFKNHPEKFFTLEIPAWEFYFKEK